VEKQTDLGLHHARGGSIFLNEHARFHGLRDDIMTLIFVVVGWLVLMLAFITAVLLVIGPGMLLQPYRRTVDYYRKHTTILHPHDLHLPFDEITMKTPEGIALQGWFVPATVPARGTVIYLHGVSECRIVGLPMAKHLHDRGYHVFLYDSRRHGDSGGKFCTYGFYEKHDASAAITMLLQRPDATPGKIALFGSSMGAAVALQTASIDHRIAGVVAESGFATLRGIFDDYQRRMIKLPWHYLRNLVIKRSEFLAHFKANLVCPVEAVKAIHVPVFILHGTADDLISSRYSEQVFAEANEPKELWLISGAKHNNMAEVGGEEYERRVLGFLEIVMEKGV
jgi:alpha-beta hydrolase superfamily lysophospholipase